MKVEIPKMRYFDLIEIVPATGSSLEAPRIMQAELADHFARKNWVHHVNTRFRRQLFPGCTVRDLTRNMQKASGLVRRQYLKFVNLTALSLYSG
jgi:hypothetical protein